MVLQWQFYEEEMHFTWTSARFASAKNEHPTQRSI